MAAPSRAIFSALTILVISLAFPRIAAPYTLEFSDKWGPSFSGGPSGATVSWSYIADGAGIDTTHYTDGTLDGVSHVGSLRSAIDAAYGNRAFDAAVARAFAAWAAAANLSFDQVTDNGAPFAGTYAINIRIGAYDFMNGGDIGGVGYGPPRDAVNFPNDPLAGDISFAYSVTRPDVNGGKPVITPFQIAPGKQGDPLPSVNGVYVNDIQGLLMHELGHALGLGHTSDPNAVMCGYVVINGVTYDGSQCTCPTCSYNTVHRQVSPDDIAGVQYLYGPKTTATVDAPIPLWAIVGLALSLLVTFRVRGTPLQSASETHPSTAARPGSRVPGAS